MRPPDAMLSECARATAPAEYRYRISAPNSQPRAVTVVALDDGSEDVVLRLARQPRGNTVFRTVSASAMRDDAGGSGRTGWLRDLTGRPVDPEREIGRAHLVVMLATAGTDVSAAALIGELSRRSGVTTTALVFGSPDPGPENVSWTLAQLRPYSMMLVTVSSADYCADMLAALRG